MDETHDPKRRSWLASANRPGTAFPIQNLPLGVFAGALGPAIGVAIGDQILDLRACGQCTDDTLNPLMALGPASWASLRARLSDLLRADHPAAADHQRSLTPHLLPMAQVTMLKPALIGDFSDFYASIYHATNVGKLFRPENPLLAELQTPSHGVHRPDIVDCPQRNTCQAALRPDDFRTRSPAKVWALSVAGLRN